MHSSRVFVSFSDVVLWLQYFKENHWIAGFNFCATLPLPILPVAGYCLGSFFSAVILYVVVERKLTHFIWNINGNGGFLWFSEQRGHFSGSDQTVENVWLKVSIAFIFYFNYTNHLDKNKILNISTSEFLLVGNQPISFIFFCSLTFKSYCLFFVFVLLFILCTCEHYFRNDGESYFYIWSRRISL